MQQPGKCPKCGCEELTYDEEEHKNGTLRYPFGCTKCGFQGYEYYSVYFAFFTDDNDQEIPDK